MAYWDTSALVKLYAREPDSAAFENNLLNAPVSPITSTIAVYEAFATFRRKEAEGILTTGAAQLLYNELSADLSAGQVRLLELGADVEQDYGRVLNACYQRVPPIPLRTLDALHLASARVSGETELVTTDKRLRDAAVALGLTLFPP